MRKAGAGLAALVDEGVDVARVRRRPQPPCLGDEVELLVLELCDRPDVALAVDDDLLAFECRVEVGHDAHAPLAVLGEDERLRRRHVFVPGAERARLELRLGWRLELRPRRAGALRPTWSDHGDAARLEIAAKLAAQDFVPSPLSRKGRIRSIGAGKTIVVDCD